MIAPPYYWGINKATGMFPGSFTVKPETFKAVLSDSIECLKSWGFKKVFTFNFHGDPLHRSTLESSINEIRTNLGIDVYNLESFSSFVSIDPPIYPTIRQDKFNPDVHAGADETAWIWKFYPNKVKVEIAKTLIPQSKFEPIGYVGDPANFDLENGIETLYSIAEYNVRLIEAFVNK